MIYFLIRHPHTVYNGNVIEFGFPKQLLQFPSGLPQIDFLFLLHRLSNICQGQTVVMSLLLGTDYTNHVSVHLIKK